MIPLPPIADAPTLAPADPQRRARSTEQRFQETLTDFDRLLAGRFHRRMPGEADLPPLVQAANRVLGQLHVKPADTVRPQPGETSAALLARIAADNGMQLRHARLDGDWQPGAEGPLVAFLDGERPVALLRGSGGRVLVEDPESGDRQPLTDALRARLGRMAFAFYPSLPAAKLTYRQVLSFGLSFAWRDYAEVLGWGVLASMVTMLTPIALAQVANVVIPNRDLELLGEIAGGLLLVLILQAVLHVSGHIAELRAEGRTGLLLHAAMVDRMLRLPAAAMRRSSTVILATQMETVAKFRKAFLKFTIMGTLAAVQVLTAAALVAFYSPLAGLIAIGAAVLLLAATALIGWRQFKAIYEGEKMDVIVLAFVYELIRLVPVLRAFRAEKRAFVQWGQNFLAFQSRLMRSARIGNLAAIIESGWEVLTVAACFAAIAFTGAAGMTTGAGLAFVAALGTLVAASKELSHAALGAAKLLPMAKLARPLIEQVLEPNPARAPMPPLHGAIEVAHAGFAYEGRQVLHDVSLQAEPGEFIGIVGASGSGKSTLLRLILGLDPPDSGAVLFDGQDLRGLDRRQVNRQIGAVLQHGQLFPGSIFENLRGVTDITLDEAWELAELAGIADELRAMPMGLHTVVGEGGAGLSGGQVQRLLIARALAVRPRILVLDEATSALDNGTQADIFAALGRRAMTRIVVSHRLSTLRRADRIYVLHQGSVVHCGRHAELAGADAALTVPEVLPS